MRITYLSVPCADEDRVVATLRRQAAAKPLPGLIRSTFGISRAGDRLEFVLVTVWTTEATIVRAIGARAKLPDDTEAFSEVVLESRVDYLPVIADS